jgi:hypothetical protein
MRSATDARVDRLEVAIITEKEEAMTGQVKRWGQFELCFASHGIHPTRSECEQAPLQGHPTLCTQLIISILVVTQEELVALHPSVLVQVELAKQQVTALPLRESGLQSAGEMGAATNAAEQSVGTVCGSYTTVDRLAEQPTVTKLREDVRMFSCE